MRAVPGGLFKSCSGTVEEDAESARFVLMKNRGT